MKALMNLIALCIIFQFITYNLNAQAESVNYDVNPQASQQGEVTFPRCFEKEDYYYNCLPEPICGYVTYTWHQNGMILNETFNGEFIGTESGAKYVINDHSSQKLIIENGRFFKFEKTAIVHRNGKPIGKLIFLFHYSYNANGELTSFQGDKYGYFWDCF
jgi:hypothetical protein